MDALSKAVLAAAVSFSLHAQAGSMRCGTALVGEGAQMAEVLEKCGPPARQDSQGGVEKLLAKLRGEGRLERIDAAKGGYWRVIQAKRGG
jgi:hypothetical protein